MIEHDIQQLLLRLSYHTWHPLSRTSTVYCREYITRAITQNPVKKSSLFLLDKFLVFVQMEKMTLKRDEFNFFKCHIKDLAQN